MKKILIIILAVSLLLCGCKSPEQKFVDTTDTAALISYYSDERITDWRVIAGLYLENQDISGYTVALYSDGSVYSDATCAISAAILNRLFGLTQYDPTLYTDSLEQAVRVPYDVATEDLCMALLALYACDITPEVITPAMTHLMDTQLSDGGWGENVDSQFSDPVVSTTVLDAITVYRDHYPDNDSYDSLLIYLGDRICNDNTVADNGGSSSSIATGRVLTSLIHAGIPTNGEISTALCTALSDFSVGGTYAEHKEKEHSNDATAEVFYTFATARRASIFYFFSDEYADNQTE